MLGDMIRAFRDASHVRTLQRTNDMLRASYHDAEQRYRDQVEENGRLHTLLHQGVTINHPPDELTNDGRGHWFWRRRNRHAG